MSEFSGRISLLLSGASLYPYVDLLKKNLVPEIHYHFAKKKNGIFFSSVNLTNFGENLANF